MILIQDFCVSICPMLVSCQIVYWVNILDQMGSEEDRSGGMVDECNHGDV